jgi:hypothetical protein
VGYVLYFWIYVFFSFVISFWCFVWLDSNIDDASSFGDKKHANKTTTPKNKGKQCRHLYSKLTNYNNFDSCCGFHVATHSDCVVERARREQRTEGERCHQRRTGYSSVFRFVSVSVSFAFRFDFVRGRCLTLSTRSKPNPTTRTHKYLIHRNTQALATMTGSKRICRRFTKSTTRTLTTTPTVTVVTSLKTTTTMMTTMTTSTRLMTTTTPIRQIHSAMRRSRRASRRRRTTTTTTRRRRRRRTSSTRRLMTMRTTYSRAAIRRRPTSGATMAS